MTDGHSIFPDSFPGSGKICGTPNSELLSFSARTVSLPVSFSRDGVISC